MWQVPFWIFQMDSPVRDFILTIPMQPEAARVANPFLFDFSSF
jgi:hypothetical protein